MGNGESSNPPIFDKLITQQEFIDETLKEKTQNIWGREGLQKMDYPSFWPKMWSEKNNSLLSNIVFGSQFQFPTFSPNLMDVMQSNNFFPKVDFKNVDAPSNEMTLCLIKLKSFDLFWNDSLEKKNVRTVLGYSWGAFQEHFLILQNYLNLNFPNQLAFFGLLDDTSPIKPDINIKLKYIPLNYRIPIYISFAFFIANYFKRENSPFLEFKIGSVFQGRNQIISDLPTSEEFSKNMEKNRIELGNFWQGMSNQLKTKDDVIAFWKKHENIVQPMRLFNKALNMGGFDFTPGIDDYFWRLNFYTLYNFRINGQKVFNFPFFIEFIDNKFTSIEKINRIIILYYSMITKDINVLFNGQFWEMPLGIAFPRIPISRIKPIDYEKILEPFDFLKSLWLKTAEWSFSGQDINYINRFGINPDKLTDLQQKIFSFIIRYPLRPLKVPGFNFREFSRQTEEWKNVANLQWNDYMKWVIANINSEEQPFYVQPGEELVDTDGNHIIINVNHRNNQGVLVESFSQNLLNSYPDYGVLKDENLPWLGREFALLFPILFVPDFIFGDEFWSYVNNFVKKVFQLVIEVLESLLKIATELLPSFLLIAAVVGGFFYITKSEQKIEISK